MTYVYSALKTRLAKESELLRESAIDTLQQLGFLHDARNVRRNRKFTSRCGREILIAEKGRIYGMHNEAINGSQVELMAGINANPVIYEEIQAAMGDKKELDGLIRRYGKRPSQNGKRYLALSVSQEDFNRTGVAGLITVPIIRIDNLWLNRICMDYQEIIGLAGD